MSEPRRITSEDLALFAMQLLSKEETAEVAAYLAQSNDARRELAEIQGDLAVYAHTVDMHSPPVQARERLTKQVAREKKADADRSPCHCGGWCKGGGLSPGPMRSLLSQDAIVPSYITEEIPPKRSVAGRVLPWVGWAAAAGLAVTTGMLYHERTAMREAMHGAMTAQASTIDRLTADVAAARQVMDTMTDSTAMRVTLIEGQDSSCSTRQSNVCCQQGLTDFSGKQSGAAAAGEDV